MWTVVCVRGRRGGLARGAGAAACHCLWLVQPPPLCPLHGVDCGGKEEAGQGEVGAALSALVVRGGSCWFVVVRGGSWWFLVVRGGLWWFVVVRGGSWWFVVVRGGSWWFVVVRGGSWWFLVIPGGSW